MKIVIINHTFQNKRYTKRWQMLAQSHKDLDVTLLAPESYNYGANKTVSFGFVEERHGFELEDGNFHIRTMKIHNHKHFGWTSKDMINIIEEIAPDIIYHIGGHRQESLMQLLKYKRMKAPKTRVLVFSMRGPQQNLANIEHKVSKTHNVFKKVLWRVQLWYEQRKINILNTYADAVFCHYPQAVDCFRQEGYEGPIYIQTQVGVDTDVYYWDPEKRQTIRNKYNIAEDVFVFASAIRFAHAKGALQILEAFPVDGNWVYFLMGSGTEQEIVEVKNKIKERGLEDKVILPGFINRDEMALHWNIADCGIHFPQTSTTWVETFSLALVQAMATKVPVIGSNSGSVPYQIGPDGIVVDEKDIAGLHNKLQWAIDHREDLKTLGEKLYKRTVSCFSIKHLDNLFYYTLQDIMHGIYDENKVNMAETTIE